MSIFVQALIGWLEDYPFSHEVDYKNILYAVRIHITSLGSYLAYLEITRRYSELKNAR